jgi:Flp pilus assembly protein TadD
MNAQVILLSGALAFSLSCVHQKQVAVRVPPHSQPAMERQVRNAVAAGDGDLLIRELRRRMAAHPGEAAPRLELARHYQDLGFSELALEHYRLAAERFPLSGEVHLKLARALREAGEQPEAVRLLEAFLARAPQRTPEFDSWLGILRDETDQWREGETSHRKALSLAPQAAYLHNNLGYNLLKQGRLPEAESEFQTALKLQPASEVARNNLGAAVAPKGGEAILHWQSVSDPASAHSNMAAWLIEQGRYPEARKELDIALGYNKSHAAALRNLELVSGLDGSPASVPVKSVLTRAQRVRAALKWLFFGGAADSNGNANQTASR